MGPKQLSAAFPWQALGNPPWAPPRQPLSSPLPSRAEVVVVGAGLTGLSAALHLTALGHEVVVVDRQFGLGATSRSGGIVLGDTLVGPDDRFRGCEGSLKAWIDARMPGALEWTGCWELDRRASLPRAPIDWEDSGPVRVSGTVEAGLVDPAALLSALASTVADRARLCLDGAGVEHLDDDGKTVRVHCGQHTIAATHVLLCTDATLGPDSADPWPDRQLTVVLETSPISDDLARAIGWVDRRPFYTNDLPLLWGRPLGGGTMLVGRELIALHDGSVEDRDLGSAIAQAGARLIRRFHHLHPALGLVSVRRVWAGPVARNATGLPAIVPDAGLRGVLRLGGYGGHGLAQSFRLGALAARALPTATRSVSRRG